jgi:DNA-binding transcriptional LysR family regulator
MDRLDELAIFLAIFEAGSLVSASRRLRRSPPAVTRALGALEDRIGLRLFERTTRRLAPTQAGRSLAERARTLLPASGTPRVPADLARHDTIFGMARSSAREWRFGQKRQGAVVRLSPRLLVDDVEAQVQAARAGRGIAQVLSY